MLTYKSMSNKELSVYLPSTFPSSLPSIRHYLGSDPIAVVAQLVDQSQSGLQLEGEVLLRGVVFRRAVPDSNRVVQYECGENRLGGGRSEGGDHLIQYLRHVHLVQEHSQLLLEIGALYLSQLLVVQAEEEPPVQQSQLRVKHCGVVDENLRLFFLPAEVSSLHRLQDRHCIPLCYNTCRNGNITPL